MGEVGAAFAQPPNMLRSLAFLDDPSSSSSDTNSSVGYVVGFCLLAVSSAVALIQAVLETRRELYGKHTLKYLLRWVAVALILENATLAVLTQRGSIQSIWKHIVYVLQATLAPALLLSMMDVTYMIHKIRCLPFYGGLHVETRSTSANAHSPAAALKFAMRLVAVLLLVLGILVNFGVLFDEEFALAGRVGWVYLIQQQKQSDDDEWTTDQQWQVILALLPMAVVTVCCCYFSLALWRYGTTFSMVVYSSPCNPWFTPFFGTMALGGTQWFGERLYPILSHVGIFVFLETILLLLLEINKDLEAENELTLFLDAIATAPHHHTKRHKKVHASVSNSNTTTQNGSHDKARSDKKHESDKQLRNVEEEECGCTNHHHGAQEEEKREE